MRGVRRVSDLRRTSHEIGGAVSPLRTILSGHSGQFPLNMVEGDYPLDIQQLEIKLVTDSGVKTVRGKFGAKRLSASAPEAVESEHGGRRGNGADGYWRSLYFTTTAAPLTAHCACVKPIPGIGIADHLPQKLAASTNNCAWNTKSLARSGDPGDTFYLWGAIFT